jgi:hypothetical protein
MAIRGGGVVVSRVRTPLGGQDHRPGGGGGLSRVCPGTVPSLSRDCPQSVPSLSPVCPWSVKGLSPVCPQSVPGLFPVCPGTVPSLSRDCPQSVPGLSLVCPPSVPILPPLVSAPFRASRPVRTRDCLPSQDVNISFNLRKSVKLPIVKRHGRKPQDPSRGG